MSDRRLGLIQFKRMTADEQAKLLTSIESTLTYSIRRGVTLTDIENEARDKLGISVSLVKMVSESRKFKMKLESRMM